MEKPAPAEPKKEVGVNGSGSFPAPQPITSRPAVVSKIPKMPTQTHGMYNLNLKRIVNATQPKVFNDDRASTSSAPAKPYTNGYDVRAFTGRGSTQNYKNRASSSLAGPSRSNGLPLKKFKAPQPNAASHSLKMPRFATPDQFGLKNPQKRPFVRSASSIARTMSEAAKMNGIETVAHTSGAEFAVPLTMQAHPIKLSDRIPDEESDIVNQTKPLPYCSFCHAVVRSWQGYEYHVLKEHIKYRAYRCVHCPKELFYTEEEGRFHTCTVHPECSITIVKDYERIKEDTAAHCFSTLLMMMRDGPELTVDRIEKLQIQASKDVMKYHWLKFKKPLVIVRATQLSDKLTQTVQVQQFQQSQYTPLRTFLRETADSIISSQRRSQITSYGSLRRPDLFLQASLRK